MSIKRYLANKDNTITSAFKVNLSNRGTSANMGSSDILEIFGIFGQASSSSLEQSRILVQFPVNKILEDRNSGKLPASGSINFKLKLFNAEHNQTVPEKITCTVTPLVKPWSEGGGLDMESYLDEGPSNWTSASKGVAWTSQGGDFLSSSYISSAPIPLHFQQYLETGIENLDIDITGLVEEFLISEAGTSTPATGSITFNQDTPPALDDKFKIYGHNGDYRIFQFSNTDGTTGNTVLINRPATTVGCVTALSTAVNTHLGSVIAATATTASTGQAIATLMVDTATFGTTALQLTNADGSTHTITAASLGGSPSSATQLNTDLIGNANDGATQLKASLDAAVLAGSIDMTVSAITNNTDGNPRVITLRQTTAGPTGAKPLAGSMITENKVIINNTGSAAQGTLTFLEPEIKVALTQRSSTFYGNTLISSSAPSGIDVDNFAGGTGALNYGVIIKLADSLEDGSQSRSYYTKKFFARSSHHFLERPVIEAQWDSSIKDDRANVIKSSSLAPAADNMNNIYLYNRIRGRLVDIPFPASNLVVKFVPSVGSTPVDVVSSAGETENYLTASKNSTGIYKVQFAYGGAEKSLHDIWSKYQAPAAATATLMVDSADFGTLNLNLENSDGTSHAITASALGLGNPSTATAINTSIIGNANDATTQLKASLDAAVTAGTLKMVVSAISNNDAGNPRVVALTQSLSTAAGNTTIGGTLVSGNKIIVNNTAQSSHGTLKFKGGITESVTDLLTGSAIAINSSTSNSYYEIPSYITKVTNLKSAYSSDEQATFRVYTRNKNWKPNIYTVARSSAPVNTIRDAYYKIRRVADDMTVITYSTSSLQSYSSLSYDISGSYFDLDMSILEPNYLYEISFLYKNGTDYVEQKERFKFRVDP